MSLRSIYREKDELWYIRIEQIKEKWIIWFFYFILLEFRLLEKTPGSLDIFYFIINKIGGNNAVLWFSTK